MTTKEDSQKWERLQAAAEKDAKAALLEALMNATGLHEYIARAIAEHERHHHGGD